jgi:hypothetical protein
MARKRKIAEADIDTCGKLTYSDKLCDSNQEKLWFQIRSECLYKFYLKNRLNSEKIFSTMLITPIFAGFVKPRPGETKPVRINEYVNWVYDNYFEEYKDKEELKYITNLGLELAECNADWFRNAFRNAFPKFTIDYDVISEENSKYLETISHLEFLQEILGVIGRDTFVTKNEYILAQNKLLKLKDKDNLECNKIKNIPDCEENIKCVFRKKCEASNRVRSLAPGDPNSYYIFEEPFVRDGKKKKEIIIFKPLSKCFIITGYSGIFRRYNTNIQGKIVETNKYTIIFPPFDGKSGPQDKSIFNLFSYRTDFWNGFLAFYSGQYIQDIKVNISDETVGISSGLFSFINDWYKKCFEPLKLPLDAEFYIIGTSLGGALTNICAFYLLNMGYKNIHYYAMGSPRVGDERFKLFMEESKKNNLIKEDSYNYVRFNYVIKDDKFYTQFDPTCKFPKNQKGIIGKLNYSDTPNLRTFGGGLTLNVYDLDTYQYQGDHDMIYNDPSVPVYDKCDAFWSYAHSVSAYSKNLFLGIKQEVDVPYINDFDQIINLDKVPCNSVIDESGNVKII